MKTLTKIKLINWHGFYDDTISLKGSALITGENGSGKSTLVDAIYFLLTGGDSNRFNAAANGDTNRTLETYMRGKTGVEGQQYLRNEPNLISHLALGFHDDSLGNDFVIGAVLELSEGRDKPLVNFYYLKGETISDDIFSEVISGKKHYVSFASLKEKRAGDKSFLVLDGTKAEIRRKIYQILSLEGKKYYELLPKAIAFRPIPDVNSFVYDFLMPEKDVDIEGIRDSIRSYNEIQKKIALDEEKRLALAELTKAGDKYKDKITRGKLLEAYRLGKTMETSQNLVKDDTSKIALLATSIANKKEEQKSLDKEISSLSEGLYSLSHGEGYEGISRIDDRLKSAEEEKNRAQAGLNDFISKVHQESLLSEKLQLNISFEGFLKNEDYEGLAKSLSEYHDKLLVKEVKVSKSSYSLETEENALRKEQASLLASRNNLGQGLPSYRPEITALREAIREGIKEKTGEDVDATPLCEMIDVKKGEESWRNAIEGYLNTRRFDLFVPEKYFDLAIGIYEREKIKRRIYGVGLVNSAKLQDEEPLTNSLASKVQCDNELAERYVNYLMGSLICVDSEQELKNYESSITRTVMIYKNKAARQTKEDIYLTPYIGRDSFSIQLQEVNKRIAEISLSLQKLAVEEKENEDNTLLFHSSQYSYIVSYPNPYARLKSALSAFESLTLEKKELQSNSSSLVGEVSKQESKLEEVKNKRSELEKEITDLSIEKTRLEDELDREKISLSSLESTLDVALSNEELRTSYKSFYEQETMSLREATNKSHDLANEAKDLESSLILSMSQYIAKFSFDASASLDSLSAFYKEYNLVVKRDLAKYGSQLESVKAQASTAFQNAYIASIREHILDEIKSIESLNKILIDKPFGAAGEVYQFEISKSKDPKFGDYYDIFMSEGNKVSPDLFTKQLSDKNNELMKTLFLKLTSQSSDATQLKLLKKYTDYRSFMNYDIKITNSRGQVFYFSKINKEKSGGETQTPFYVIIAASFEEIVQDEYDEKSSGCIVILDEAFNNMDESHIDSMMEYFQSLRIQPIIAVPSQRARSIMPYVSSTIALVKSGDRILPRSLLKA